MKKLLFAAVAAAAVGLAGAAGAATFSYSTDFSAGVGGEWSIVGAGVNSGDAGILGQLSSGVATLGQTSVGSGSGSMAFDLLGFRTVDGVNCCTDLFSLRINGALVFQAAFAMGGGGGEAVFIDTNGAAVTGGGSSRHITLSFAALTGANAFAFDYGPMQGFGDEAWGLDNVSFSATVTDPPPPPPPGGVPEPATWAMMIGGFAGMGAMLRRRRTAAAAA